MPWRSPPPALDPHHTVAASPPAAILALRSALKTGVLTKRPLFALLSSRTMADKAKGADNWFGTDPDAPKSKHNADQDKHAVSAVSQGLG